MKIFLVEVGYLNAGVPGTLRLSNKPYTTKPIDTPASVTYEPHLNKCTFRYDATKDPLRLGNGEIGVGNTNYTRDGILDYTYDNQMARLLVVEEGAAYSTAKELARWAVEQPESMSQDITIRTRTPFYNLDRSLQTVRFGGTGGLDGGSELANKPMAIAIGPVINAKATLVDASKNIYLLSSTHDIGPYWASQGLTLQADQDATGIVINDEGIAITQGAAYTSVAQMNSTAPIAGQCRVCNAFASGAANNYAVYVRFQSDPAGEVTYSMVSRANMIGNATIHAIGTLIQTATAGQGQLTTADASRITSTFPYHVSLSFRSDGDPATYLDALRMIMTGMRGWIVPYGALPTEPGNFGGGGSRTTFAVRWLETPATMPPSGYGNYLLSPDLSITPYLTINGSQIVKDSFKRKAEYDVGWPEFRTTALYDRVQYLQTTGLAGGVTPAQRARLALEYLSAADEDLSVKDDYPTAVDRVITSAWSSAVGTIANEATRQLDVFKVPHPTFQLSARADLYHAALTVPGDPMTVENHPRFGCDVSRVFQINGMAIDYLDLDSDGNVGVDLTLFG